MILASITPLSLIVVALLAAAILYPDDPGNRAARVRRTMLTTLVFAIAIHLSAIVVQTSPPSWPAALIDPFIPLWIGQLSLVPFSIAERVAELFRPSRTPWWWGASLAGSLAWSGLLYAVFWRGPNPPLPWVAVTTIYALPAIAAGLAWHAQLPRREQRVVDIFA